METPPVPASALRLGRGGDGLADWVRGAWGLGIAWMIGLPRRGGARLYAMNDAEARWRRWHVAERRGGLARQYRDARFELLRHDLGAAVGLSGTG